MLTSGRHKDNPLAAHRKHLATIMPLMFDRWLVLWAQVTDKTMRAPMAAALQAKAGRIAQSLTLALYFRLPPCAALVMAGGRISFDLHRRRD